MARISPRHQRRLLRLPVTPAFAFVRVNCTKSCGRMSMPFLRSGRSARGWLLASDSLPCWRKARPKAMVRHRFRGLLPFCPCCGASRQKGRRDEIGSPSWLCAVAHHAAQPPRASHPTLYSLLCSRGNRPGTAVLRWWRVCNTSSDWGKRRLIIARAIAIVARTNYGSLPLNARQIAGATTITIDRNICALCDTDRSGRSARQLAQTVACGTPPA